MKLPSRPHLLALLCCAGLLASSGVLLVKSQTPATLNEKPPAAEPAPMQAQSAPAVPATPTYSAAQIDQWVAPVALYPDALLSQILMAATYPTNMVQAAQWSQDHPKLQGDAAIQAVAGQPWDASVKSLVAFPQLMSLLGQNPQWIQNLGDAFLAQPDAVMDSVQRLRALAKQTGALTSSPQQKVTTITKAAPPAAAEKTAAAAAPQSSTIIKIEPAEPQVVYVPTYNPNTVYGAWPNASYPPVWLPPTPGEQFGNSFVKGLGYSLGVATTYALFSNIDWDDDDHHHHHDDDDDDDYHDDHHHNGYSHNGDNININVNNFNQITGEHRAGDTLRWQHNPAYRNGVAYADNRVAAQFHSTASATGLSAVQRPVDRDGQRQAAMTRLQQSAGKTASLSAATRETQRQTASQQLQERARRSNYRGYDGDKPKPQRLANRGPHTQLNKPEREANLAARQVHAGGLRANALSGNDSRSANWQAQQQRGLQSRQLASVNRANSPARERLAEHRHIERRR